MNDKGYYIEHNGSFYGPMRKNEAERKADIISMETGDYVTILQTYTSFKLSK